MKRSIALVLTVLTGFSGLAYQITWQKYLATLLGSHSEATAAVLGIFLGGLSVGYWLFGRLTLRLTRRAAERGRAPRLLWAYGLLEAGIGVYALLFPLLFRGVQAISFALPYGADGIGFAVDVLLVALLIGPATVLMGGTIPILTQALSETLEEATRFHALVYAFNTAGAFAGALATGFSLVPTYGLVRVMIAMGCVNLFAGGVFLLIGFRSEDAGPAPPERSAAPSVEGFGTYATIALLVGFAMMVMQTGVIRVAGLSFGSSQFTFAMVVSIFVLGIALGSFAVSALPSVRPFHVLANQWVLALLVLLLYFALPEAPFVAYLVRQTFDDSHFAFWVYQVQAFLLLGVLCGPAILCSGASLPLLFHQLRNEVGDLGNVAGSLYSWNTVGSLLGALLGGYALLFWLDLHDVYALAIGALLLAAALLTVRVLDLGRAAALAMLPVMLVPALLAPWNPTMLSMGLFRARDKWEEGFSLGELRAAMTRNYRIVSHEDDPTMTVTVTALTVGNRESVTIKTNGKPDGNSLFDYTTMAMAGFVPALFADDPRRAFVIGWGTGTTAGELARLESIEEVVVAEISPGVIASAPHFEFTNRHAASNPKVEIIRSDAYRALMRAEGSFDVIVSEPSNPWVAGVENLFSREFLTVAKEHLSPGGVYGQWFHQYEVDDATLELVLRTYAEVFDHVSIWFMQDTDLLLLGFDRPDSARDHFRLEARTQQPDYQAALRRAQVEGFAALLAHEVWPLGVLHAAELEGPTQSLFHPRLAYIAGRAFFMRDRSALPFTGTGRAAEVGSRNSLLRLYANRFGGHLPEEARFDVANEVCEHARKECYALLARWRAEEPGSAALAGLLEDLSTRSFFDPRRLDDLEHFFGDDRLRPEGPIDADRATELGEAYERYYHHAAPFDPERYLAVWDHCRIAPPSPRECERMIEESDADPFGIGRESLMEKCGSLSRIGRACEQGRDRARELLLR